MPAVRVLSLVSLFLAISFAHADVTVRYKTDVKPAFFAPPGLPQETVLRLKAAKCAGSLGTLTVLMDMTDGRITVVDASRKLFATVSTEEFAEAVEAAFPDLSAEPTRQVIEVPGATHAETSARKTGRSTTILRIEAEEEESELRMEMPVGDQKLAMKIVSRFWAPKAEEFRRVPALRELAALDIWARYLSKLPGSPATLTASPSGIPSLFVRMESEMTMSGMPGMDGTSPTMRYAVEIAELSNDALDDALFRVPEGFTGAPAADLMRSAAHSLASPATPTGAAPVATDAKAFVPRLTPLEQTEPELPEAARAQNVQGRVELLVTVDARGAVSHAEALSGPALLRDAAIETVRGWRFRPVIRDGQPVSALTTQDVFFFDSQAGSTPALTNLEEEMAALNRTRQLEEQFPRTPQQTLADLEQDAAGGDELRRFYLLDGLARSALGAGAEEKAATYASEMLRLAAAHRDDWNYGNAIFLGHTVLGLVALRRGDVAAAKSHLIEAGNTPGSPQLDSFGPDMSLAKQLLEKGERGAVLDFFAQCRKFWKMGIAKLDAWSDAVVKGETPRFEMNLR